MYKSTYLLSLSNVFKLKKEIQSKQIQYTIFLYKTNQIRTRKKEKEKKKIENADLAIWVTRSHILASGEEYKQWWRRTKTKM